MPPEQDAHWNVAMATTDPGSMRQTGDPHRSAVPDENDHRDIEQSPDEVFEERELSCLLRPQAG